MHSNGPVNLSSIPWSKRLGIRLGWIFTLFMVLILVAMGLGLIRIAERGLEQQIDQFQNRNAQEAARLISDYVASAVDSLVFYNSAHPLVGLSPSKQKKALDQLLLLRDRQFHELTLLDHSGMEIAKVSQSHTYLPHELASMARSDIFSGAIGGGVFVGSSLQPSGDGVLCIPLSVPIAVPGRGTVNVLAAKLNIARLWEEIGRMEIGQSGCAYLVDPRGRLIAHQEPALMLQKHGEDVSRIPAVADFMASTEQGSLRGRVYTGFGGEKVIGQFRRVPRTQWAVIVELPEKEAFASLRLMKYYLACLMGVGALITLGISVLGLRRTIRSINLLSSKAKAMAQGDLTQNVTIQGHDEIGALAAAFNSMSGQLRDMVDHLEKRVEARTRELTREVAVRRKAEDSLRKAHDDLEIKVQERTAELSRTNEALNLEIRERIQMTKALQSSEQRFRDMANSLPQVVFETDETGRLTFVNQNAYEEFGFSPEDMEKGLNALDMLAPEDLERAMGNMMRSLAGETIGGAEYTARRKDGSTFPMVVHSKRILQAGQPKGLRGIIVDLTGHKKNEERLAEALAFTEKIISESPVGILMYDASGKCIAANPSIARIVGATREQLLAQNYHHIQSWKDSGLYDVLQEALREKRTMRHRMHAVSSFQVPVALDSFVAPFETEGQTHLLVMMNDIMDQIKAEGELRKLRNLLSNIVNSMPSVLVGVDPEGRITQWNREAEKRTGVLAERANQRFLDEVFPELARQMDKVRQAIIQRKPATETRIPSSQNGEMRFADITVFPLVTNGLEGAVIRMDDVTDRVRIEEMMVQSEKMLSVGGLAAGMAHEINNPLAGIIQNAQVMKRRLSVDFEKNQAVAEKIGLSMGQISRYMEQRGLVRMLDAIHSSGLRAGKIVENMLSFSRKSQAEFTRQDVNELLDQTVELASSDYDLKKKYDFRQIRIVRNYAGDLPQALCERSKIQQVMLNLLRNAAHAMADCRDPAKQPVITLTTALEGDRMRIEVADNGPGMEESVRKRIFEPFFTTKEAGAGTGLGLSVSYFIITEGHGGAMTVESSPGNGAKFIIRLPVNEPAEPAH